LVRTDGRHYHWSRSHTRSFTWCLHIGDLIGQTSGGVDDVGLLVGRNRRRSDHGRVTQLIVGIGQGKGDIVVSRADHIKGVAARCVGRAKFSICVSVDTALGKSPEPEKLASW
jgi:hypothetical protein